MEIKKYSKEHQFIAYERSRNETHVIVGYAYRWFSDAKTTISQYAIPISDWEDKEKFITFNDYVKENLTTGEKYNLHNINYCLSINAFFIEHLEDSMSTINERNHRKIHRINVVMKRLIIQMMISWKYMINIK